MQKRWCVIQVELPRSELLPPQFFPSEEKIVLRFFDVTSAVQTHIQRYRDRKQLHLDLLRQHEALIQKGGGDFKTRLSRWYLIKKLDWHFRREQAHKDLALQSIRYRLGEVLRMRRAVERPNIALIREGSRYRPLLKYERDALRSVYDPQKLQYMLVFQHGELDSGKLAPIEEIV